MTEQALPRPARFPWLLPVALFVLLMAGLGAIFVFARESGKSESPPSAGEFQVPAGMPYIAYDVERSESGTLTVSSGSAQNKVSSELQLPAETRVWLLEPVEAADLKPPLIANVIAIPNEVRNYTLRLLAFAPAAAGTTFETPLLPLADGFFGFETSRDPSERTITSAILESFDGRNGVTRTSTGPGTLFVDADSPVRLLRQATPSDIQPGDRLALHPDASGQPDPAQGVFVLTGGAR